MDSRRAVRRSITAALALSIAMVSTVHAQSDSCASATAISGNGTHPFNLATATNSPEGQTPWCGTGGPVTFANDVWFCWTATCNGLVSIQTCGLTTVDTRIAYYIGCTCPSNLDPFCCDDDSCGLQSAIHCEAECGQQFLIRIGCKPGTTPGPGSVNITCNGTPCTGSCDDCCGKKPQFLPAAGFPGTVAVATQEGSFGMPVVTIVNISNQASAPTGTNWNAANFYAPAPAQKWAKTDLGSVFGVTLDDVGNIYVAHSSVYGNPSFPGTSDGIGTITNAAAGAIYKVDTNTGVAAWFKTLPNNMLNGCTGTECWPGLGNICFDCKTKTLYVSNHEDGRIYQLSLTGTVLSTWKHSTGVLTTGANAGNPDPFDVNGFAPMSAHSSTQRGQRVWAVQTHTAPGGMRRLYYSVWREDSTTPDPLYNNEVWSVGLNIFGHPMLGTEQIEVKPPLFGVNWNNPVADISFTSSNAPSAPCCMLLGERVMGWDTYSGAHQSRLLEYCYDPTIPGWMLSTNVFTPGSINAGLSQSCAGGVDYDYDNPSNNRMQVWCTADAIKMPNDPGPDPYIYGLLGLSASGGSPLVFPSIMIDLDQNTGNSDKLQMGDVEIPCPNPPPPCQAHTNGMQCVNTCAGPASMCVPIEVTRGLDGLYRITRCDCIPTGMCHLQFNGPDLPPTCVDPCPQPSGGNCTLVTRTNMDGTTTFRCQCLTVPPPDCRPVTVTDPNNPVANTQACAGPCANGQPCIPVEIREFPAGSGNFTILRCDCNAPPCHPIVVEGHVVCVGNCPEPDGGHCKVVATPEPPDPAHGEGIRYTCICDCQIPPASMVDWWPMNALAPVKDRANLLNHGTATGGVTVGTSCVGQGLTFNGVNGVVTVPQAGGGAPDINFAFNDFTLEGWVQTASPGYQPILDKRAGNFPSVFGYVMFIQAGGNLGFQIGSGTFANFFTTGFNLQDGQCHHVAAVVRRGSPNQIRLYVDGAFQSFTNANVTGSLNNTADLLFGRDYNFAGGGSPTFYRGSLDDWEFYRRALTSQEITDLFQARTMGKCCDVCYTPPVVFCANETTRQLCFQLCNYCDGPARYSWNLSGPTGGAGCAPTGPITFSPASGVTGVIPPAECRTICVTVTLPSGMPIPPPIISACYQFSTTNIITGKQFSCGNTVTRSREVCFECTPPCPIATVLQGTSREFALAVTNESFPGSSIDYTVRVRRANDDSIDEQAVGLNGLPPGVPVIGTLAFGPGGTTVLPVVATVMENDPFRRLEIVLEADTDGDALPDPVERIAIHTALCATGVVGDMDEDGVSTGDDIDPFISAIFGFPRRAYDVVLADTNCDGMLSSADVPPLVNALLSGL